MSETPRGFDAVARRDEETRRALEETVKAESSAASGPGEDTSWLFGGISTLAENAVAVGLAPASPPVVTPPVVDSPITEDDPDGVDEGSESESPQEPLPEEPSLATSSSEEVLEKPDVIQEEPPHEQDMPQDPDDDEEDDGYPDDEDSSSEENSEDEEVFDDEVFDEDDNLDPFALADNAPTEVDDEGEDAALEETLEEEAVAEERQEQHAREEYASTLSAEELIFGDTGESSLDSLDSQRLRSHIVGAVYPSRNPAPMSREETRIDENRPMSRLGPVSSEDAKIEPLKFSGSHVNVKVPVELVETVRTVAIQSLTNTTQSLSENQERQVRAFVGTDKYAELTHQQKCEAWISFINKKFSNSRLTLAFLIAQANVDVDDLDETTALIVRELRAVDPVLRELHVNTSRVDALEASERASRRMQAEMVQTLKELELAASFMLAWTTAEGSTGVASWKPGTMNLLNHSSKAARDRLQRLTKSDMVALKKTQGRPF